ncbi:MAG: PEP-CTERM sorting domain-containing protein [Chloroflexi bacterium]|nr:PEP-CTERM sorting domain-containing protein [Chloroflexota bacterium]
MKRANLKLTIPAIATLISLWPAVVNSQSFFEDFDVDHSANWVVNKSTGANANDAGSSAEFFFDYSTVGIPSAPHSVGATTRGLRMQANKTGGIISGLSVSPIGQSFAGDYTLRFDMWLNYNGPLGPSPVGGNGSTQITSAGIGTAGTTPQWASGTQDSVWFGATGDGGTTADYRAYSPAAATGTGYTAPSGVFAAGTGTSPDARNAGHPYYAGFSGASAPEAQLALFPGQTGTTAAGAPGMAWRDVIISKEGNLVSYSIDGLPIANVDISAITLGGGNIFLGHFDPFSGSSTDANAVNVLFGLVDNVNVTPVPEPATYAAVFGLLAGAFALIRRRAS